MDGKNVFFSLKKRKTEQSRNCKNRNKGFSTKYHLLLIFLTEKIKNMNSFLFP